jgi:hypothetical protein
MIVEEFLAPYTLEVRALALQLRALVLSTLPDPVEQVQPGYKTITYGTGTAMRDEVCYIAPLKSAVNLGFFRGTELPDPDNLLRGTGKRLRHVKVTNAAEVDNAGLRQLLHSAITLAV